MELRQKIYEKNRINYAIACVSVAINTVLTIAISFLFKDFTDVAISGTLEEFHDLIIRLIIFLIAFAMIEMISFYYKNRFIERGIRQYKDAAFKRILSKHIASFQKESTSTYISALTNDVNSIEMNYLDGGFQIFGQTLLFVGGLAAMFYLNVWLTIAVILMCLLPLGISMVFATSIEKSEQQTSMKNAGFTGLIKGLLDGFTVIKSFQAEKEIQKNVIKENHEVEKIKRKRRNLISMVTLMSSIGGFLVSMSVFVVGGYLAIQKELSVGVLIAFVQLTNYVVSPLQIAPSLISARKASKSLIDKLQQTCKIQDIEVVNTPCINFENEIEFKQVNFSYDKEHMVLQDIQCHFEKGKSYAIVGGSGSGKSTLLQLLLGYHAYDGDIQIDHTSMKQIMSDHLYELFSMIQQNVFIFDDTLENNITLYKRFDEQQIEKAVKMAGLYDFWKEKGKDYPCGENGIHLSGGEKQRLSIARSLLKDTPILLMDEATAALDVKTSYMIEDAILRMKDKTRIVVTHKLQKEILSRYDEILVIGKHTIIEKGTFDELYQQKGYFYSLYTIQG